MLRGITKKRKHTHRRRTMRKKNRTMRRRHSSHLKHSRRNLHRRREGGGGEAKLGHFVAKGVVKVAKAYNTKEEKAKQDAKYARLTTAAKEKRDKFLISPPGTFSARPFSNQFTLVPTPAFSASTAPRLASAVVPSVPQAELLESSRLYRDLVSQGMVAPRNDFSAPIQRSNLPGQ